jgi:hypothetical protein
MTLQQLIDTILNDPGFWNELKKDPAKAVQGLGQNLTPEQLRALKELNYRALQDVGSAFAGQSAIT